MKHYTKVIATLNDGTQVKKEYGNRHTKIELISYAGKELGIAILFVETWSFFDSRTHEWETENA